MNEYVLEILNTGYIRTVAIYNKELKEVCFIDNRVANTFARDFMKENDFKKIGLCITQWIDEDYYNDIKWFANRYKDNMKFVICPSETAKNKPVDIEKYNDDFKCEQMAFDKPYEMREDQVFDWLKVYALMVDIEQKKENCLQFVLEIGQGEKKNYVYIPGNNIYETERLTVKTIEEGKLPKFKEFAERGFDVGLLSNYKLDSVNSSEILSMFPRLLTIETFDVPLESVAERLKQKEMFYLSIHYNTVITIKFKDQAMYVKTKDLEKQITEMIHDKEIETLQSLMLEIAFEKKDIDIKKFFHDASECFHKNKLFNFEEFITFLKEKNCTEYIPTLEYLQRDLENLYELRKDGLYITPENVNEISNLCVKDGLFKETLWDF